MNNLARVEELPEPDTHRFFLPDLSELGIWLVSRLKTKYASVAEPTLTSWLRSLMQSQDYLFVRKGRAVLLAQMIREGVEASVTVKTIFSLCQDGGNKDGASLYNDLERWAVSLGAREIIVGDFNDVPEAMIAEILGGKLQKRSVLFCRIQK